MRNEWGEVVGIDIGPAKHDEHEHHVGHEKRAGEELQAQEQSVADLFALGNAATEEDFRLRARHAAATKELKTAERDLERRLEGLSGPGEKRVALETDLATLDQQGVLQRREETAQALAAVEVRRDELQAELGGLASQLALLEREDEVTSVGRELAAKDAELAEAAEQWAVLKLTQWLLERTRKKFETERQPAVIRNAGNLMGRLTGGRYPTIVAPEGLSEVALESPDGARKGLEAWSRGTREQLYLALRFAFVQGGIARR